MVKDNISQKLLKKKLIENLCTDYTSISGDGYFIADKTIAAFLSPYTEWRFKNHFNSPNSSPIQNNLEIAGLKLELTTSNLSLEFKYAVFTVLTAPLYTLLLIVMLFSKSKRKSRQYNLFYSITKEQLYKNNSLKKFENFITDSRFDFTLKKNRTNLIEQKRKRLVPCKSKVVTVTRSIPLYLYRNNLTLLEKIKVISKSMKICLYISLHINRCPSLYLVTKELVIDKAIYEELISKQDFETTLITTQSQLFVRPIIFYMSRRSSKNMIWYSANNDPILKSASDFRDYEDSFYDLQDINTHYVWTESQKAKIQQSNQRNIEIKVVGSIIFEPRDLTLRDGLNSYPIITYFDVTPTSHMYFQESFYSEKNMIDNLTAVVNSVQNTSINTGKNLMLRIKPKRSALKGHHSLKYLQVLDKFADNGVVTMLQSEQNTYSLVKQSSLVICVPFSSPCLIAKELKVPTIYFSENREYLLGSSHEEIEVLVGAEALSRYLITMFRQFDC